MIRGRFIFRAEPLAVQSQMIRLGRTSKRTIPVDKESGSSAASAQAASARLLAHLYYCWAKSDFTPSHHPAGSKTPRSVYVPLSPAGVERTHVLCLVRSVLRRLDMIDTKDFDRRLGFWSLDFDGGNAAEVQMAKRLHASDRAILGKT
jgi:hypothetical protein